MWKPLENTNQLGQILDGDFAGVFLVHRRQVIELDAREFHLQQAIHGQLAARVRETDDDAVHLSLRHDGRNVVDRADDVGRDRITLANLRGVSVDEPDDVHRQLDAPRVEFARKCDGLRAGAHQQQPFARCPAAQPAFGETPTRHDDNDEQAGDEKHAAADFQGGNPEVEHRQDE